MVGTVYGLSTNQSEGIDEIKFSIGLAPGAPAINLEKLDIVFSTPDAQPIILTQGANASKKVFTTKQNALTPVTHLQPTEQVEINFKVATIPKDTVVNIEIRPAEGAALPFSRTTPATITSTNILS
jgi:archaellin